MPRVILTVHCFAAAHALSATAPSASRAAYAEWLVPLCPGLDGSRATLADDFTVTAARAYNADQVIYSIGNDALLSPVAAYADKDVGPPLRDIAQKAGPGFGVVAVAGLLAAEKIRGFRSRRGQGDAAAAAGIVVPSFWGPYTRLLWDEPVTSEADAQLVDQAVALLLPILETTARRAWTAPDPEKEPQFLSEQWAWRAMYEDGGSKSWSRGELVDLARGALGVAIASQRPPLAGDAWQIKGQAVRSAGLRADAGESSEATALVPLVGIAGGDANAAFRAFTDRVPAGEVAPALVCVATRDISAGDAVVARDPWG